VSDPQIYLTGATGFLGWHLAEAFRDRGWNVTAVVRPGNKKPLPARVESIERPLEAEALARAFEGASLIVHAAGLTHAPGEAAFNAVNVEGTRAIVTAANRVGSPLILMSSQAAAGSATRDRPSREDDTPAPLTAYGRSKLGAEAVVKSGAQTPWLILRPSAVYGPRDRQFLPLFRLASRGWFLLAADPAATFTLVYVEDLARAVVLAALALTAEGGAGQAAGPLTMGGPERAVEAGGKVLFLGHPLPQTSDEVLRALAATYRRPYRPRRVPHALLEGFSWIGELSWTVGRQPLLDRARLVELRASGFVCTVDEARDELGFRAEIGLAEGVERTARWYRNQGWV
jgi:nucleoside-diphosphate-sugar epimerase